MNRTDPEEQSHKASERERRVAARKKRQAEDPPANYEGALEAPPAGWQRFYRPGRLDVLIAELDERLERERADTTQRIARQVGLAPEMNDDQPAPERGLGLVAGTHGAFMAEGILGPLGLWLHDEKRARAGEEELRLRDPRRKDDATPFKSVEAALVFLVHQRSLGMGSVNLQLAEDREEDVVARGRARWQGRLSRSAVGACATCGHAERAHARDAGACGIGTRGRRARCACAAFRRSGAPAGYLPSDFMPAKQSRAGNLGTCRGADAIVLATDVVTALHAAGLGRVDRVLLLLAVVGEPKIHKPGACWCGRSHVEPAEGTASAAGAVELVRTRGEPLAKRINEWLGVEDLVSAEALGWRVARLREHVHDIMAARGLLPKREQERRRRRRAEPPRMPFEAEVESA